VASLAAITAVRVASVLHEPQLTAPNDGDATLANLLPEALIAVQSVIRAWGVDPAQVTNGEDFEHIQADWIGWRYFGGMPGEEAAAKSAKHLETWMRWVRREVPHPRPITGSGDAQARGGRRGPVVMNRESEPVFARGADTARVPPPTFYEEQL